jgi:hypothetical protein
VSLLESVVATNVKSAMGAAIESAGVMVMPSGVASAVRPRFVMRRTRSIERQIGPCVYVRKINSQRLPFAQALANLADRHHDRGNQNAEVKISEQESVAGAAAATATGASARESTRRLCRSAVTRAIRRGEHRKLNCVLLPGAFRAGNFLPLVQHNFFKVCLAILAYVFVNWHFINLS